MSKIKTLISKRDLNKRIGEIANEISKDFNKEPILIVCVLKGATYFAVDLSKKIKDNKVEIDFMKISSYSGTTSTGKVNIKLDVNENIEGRNVIIVEDIIDTGISLNYLYDHLIEKKPKSLKIAVLLDKKERRVKDINVDYTGFVIEDKFVVGYGLDYDEQYRNLDYIGYIE
jgi:hypoxanthine phosphoribosyltransferase